MRTQYPQGNSSVMLLGMAQAIRNQQFPPPVNRDPADFGLGIAEFWFRIAEMAHVLLTPGDPAPRFRQRSGENPAYAFDTAAGRYLVLCFLGSAGDSHAQRAVAEARARPDLLDDAKTAFFAVSNDPADEAGGCLNERIPGYRLFWDFDRSVARLYGAIRSDDTGGASVEVRRIWVVLDPMLRVLQVFPFAPDQSDIAALIDYLDALPPPDRFAGCELQAPIPSPIRRVDQPQRRLRRWRSVVSRIWPARLSHGDRCGGGVLLLAAPRRASGHPGGTLRLSAVPV